MEEVRKCERCGQIVPEDETAECPLCLIVTCFPCGGQVYCCWYCGDGSDGAKGQARGKWWRDAWQPARTRKGTKAVRMAG